MRLFRSLALLAFAATPLRAQDGALQVLRHSPADSAGPATVVTVTFDRPVAGGLERTIPAERVLHMQPSVAGRAEWRDPVTIRFVPKEPLMPGSAFTVTADTTVRGMDGSRLAQPYHFSFRVRGARMLDWELGGRIHGDARTLSPSGQVRVLYSAPVDLERFSARARLELTACGSVTRIPLRAVRQSAPGAGDPYYFRDVGDWNRDTTEDRFHRIVELEPARTPPADCSGRIVLPTTAEDARFGIEEAFPVRTVPTFRLEPSACSARGQCPMDAIALRFTTPVSEAEVKRHLHLQPSTALKLSPRTGPSTTWSLDVRLTPRSRYAVVADSALRDVYGRQLSGPHTLQVVTGDYTPSIGHASGSVVVPRSGSRTIPVRHVNVRTLRVISVVLPESRRLPVLTSAAVNLDTMLLRTFGGPDTTLITLRAPFNVERITEVPLPSRLVASASGVAALRFEIAERLPSPELERAARSGALKPVGIIERAFAPAARPYLIVQLTDLAVHARVGNGENVVLVTGLVDGRPRAGATVKQVDVGGTVVASGLSGPDGIARLRRSHADTDPAAGPDARSVPGGVRAGTYIVAELAGDRSATPQLLRTIGYEFWSPLDPWQLGGRARIAPPAAAALYTDRGIYRPGEMLHLGGVVRTGWLGALTIPAAIDSVRLTVTTRQNGWRSDEDVVIRDTLLALTEFGTLTDSLLLRPGMPLGYYDAELAFRGETIAHEEFRLAEYRAPEFLVEMQADSAPRFAADTVRARISARYLFGAPMGHARLQWSAVLHELTPWELRIPGADGWTVGEWHDDRETSRQVTGVDSLRADGMVEVRVPLENLRPSRPGRLEISAAVVDVNRQAISAGTSVPVHPARLYVLGRRAGAGWYWTVGQRATVEIRTVTPDGKTLDGVPVTVALVRRDWASGRGWTDSLLRTDTIRTGVRAASWAFVPERGGAYELRMSASDGRGGVARTTLSGYAVAGGSTWWANSAYHLPLVAERKEVAVGDSAKVLFESPFESAEAWISIEREGMLEQRRTVMHRGANVVPLLVSQRHVPNVFVSVLLLRRDGGRTAVRPDSASQLIRAGYVELTVRTDVKRLAVAIEPAAKEYGPGDTAAVHVRVTDARGRGARSEVTLWAVDEGILALTGFRTPDVLAQLYEPRGLGLRLTSTLPQILTSSVPLAMVLQQQLMARASSVRLEAPVVTGAPSVSASDAAAGASLRRDFRSIAFYLGAQRTDDSGRVVVRAPLPDNLTTYRVMAVAVGADDRAGSGESALLVSRPLVARPTLPRFVRASDTLLAGAVVNVRDGGARSATVAAQVEGMWLQGAAQHTVTLAAGRGAESRFGFTVPPRDSAPAVVTVRLRATDGRSGDAVEARLPVRPDFHPRTHIVIGAVRGSAEIVMPLPAGIDRARSTVTVRVGTSPIVPMLASYRYLRDYPWDCTEQLASRGRALLAVWRLVGDRDTATVGGDPRAKLQQIADELLRRQRADGAIRYWSDNEWTSPWLTAYAGTFLQEARARGIAVDSSALRGVAVYLARSSETPIDTGGMNRHERRSRRLALGGRVAVAEYLRMAGLPLVEVEDELLRLAAQMTWEDRLRLAEALAARQDVRTQTLAMVDAAWAAVTVAGNRIDLPDSAHAERQFPSRLAPASRLLTATIALRPSHPLIGGLLETVIQQGRAERGWAWSTQDHASLVMALASLADGDTTIHQVRLEQGRHVLASRRIGAGDSVVALPLEQLVVEGGRGAETLRLSLHSDDRRASIYYAVSLTEIPASAPTKPDIKGIVVERWYERFADGLPVTSVQEGDLVRVRLRVTVPAERMFVAVEDPLPAGLEPVDLHLRTSGTLQPFSTPASELARMEDDRDRSGPRWQAWLYGRWDDGWWSPWEHEAMYDDRVVYFARMLWPGSYSASYVARATTAGSFVRPPAYAEEMYNPAVQGRSDGGRFGVR